MQNLQKMPKKIYIKLTFSETVLSMYSLPDKDVKEEEAEEEEAIEAGEEGDMTEMTEVVVAITTMILLAITATRLVILVGIVLRMRAKAAVVVEDIEAVVAAVDTIGEVMIEPVITAVKKAIYHMIVLQAVEVVVEAVVAAVEAAEEAEEMIEMTEMEITDHV